VAKRWPDFSIEQNIWKRGFEIIIGVDEVGRGAFAGPVVAGACALKIKNYESRIKNQGEKITNSLDSILKLGINDSKKLTPKRREKLAPEIKKYFYWAVGEGSVAAINGYGIKKATEIAMRQAIIRLFFQVASHISSPVKKLLTQEVILRMKPYLILDAFHIKYVPIVGLRCQQAIIGGDGKSVSIAASSIVAKVYRDNLMRNLCKDSLKRYRWDENKGYGTADHREAIKSFGITKFHRKQFVASWMKGK
jgi:ribonuclease HII